MNRTEIQYRNFRTIEAELRCLEKTKADLELYKQLIREESPFQEAGVCVQSGSTSDSTYNKAAKVIGSPIVMETERRLMGIELGLQLLKQKDDKPLYNLVKLKYLDKDFTDQRIMRELSVSSKTFYRCQNEAIYIIASVLGWDVGMLSKM